MQQGWLLLALVLVSGTVKAAPAARYEITPERVAGKLTGLRVRLDLPARPGSTIRLAVPDGVRSRLAPSGFTIDGGTVAGQDGLSVKAASAHVSVTYRLLSDGSRHLQADSQGMAIHAGWFSVRGDEALIVPEGDGTASVDLAAPDGWVVASSIEGPTAIKALGDSQFVGGANYRVAAHRVGGTVVRMAFPEGLAGRADALIDDAATIAAAETTFWQTPPKPVFVAIVEMRDESEFSGRGIRGGFSLYLGRAVDRKAWQRLMAHENLHTWISRAIGGFPEKDDDLEAWLNEGFTEAYTARILRASGLWTQDDYVADWNLSLTRYGTSPVKEAPNSRILADRNRDFDVNRLPYDRGRLLAVRWDRVFRQRTGGRVGLDDVLRAQMVAAAHNDRKGHVVSADRLFPVVTRRMTGLDLGPDMKRYVDEGALITVPENAFGPCIRVESVTQPVFDRGFDLDATIRAHGRVAGLEPGGPAERAGLKAGYKIRIDETPTHDSRVTLNYRVDDGNGQRHTVSYRPQGKDSVTFQQLAIIRLDAAACPIDRF